MCVSAYRERYGTSGTEHGHFPSGAVLVERGEHCSEGLLETLQLSTLVEGKGKGTGGDRKGREGKKKNAKTVSSRKHTQSTWQAHTCTCNYRLVKHVLTLCTVRTRVSNTYIPLCSLLLPLVLLLFLMNGRSTSSTAMPTIH